MHMNKYITYIIGLLFIGGLSACEDVVDLNVPQIEPRLVVQGSITDQPTQEIRLTFSADYFNSNDPVPAAGATVELSDESGEVFSFVENPTASGIYQYEGEGVVGKTYTLNILLNDGRQFRSNPETLLRVSEITGAGYIKDDGFGNDSDSTYVVLLSAIEPQDTRDFYRWKIFRNDTLLSDPEDLSFARDDFVNEVVVAVELYRGNDIGMGDSIRVQQLSITESYFEFLNTLFTQTAFRGGIFDTPPAPIKGNVFNVTEPSDYALGYFNASAVNEAEFTIVD